jgi:hypothetical protein
VFVFGVCVCVLILRSVNMRIVDLQSAAAALTHALTDSLTRLGFNVEGEKKSAKSQDLIISLKAPSWRPTMQAPGRRRGFVVVAHPWVCNLVCLLELHISVFSHYQILEQKTLPCFIIKMENQTKFHLAPRRALTERRKLRLGNSVRL